MIYLAIFFLITLFSIWGDADKKAKTPILVCIILIISFFAGFRDGIWTDWALYKDIFKYNFSIPNDIETGYLSWNYLVNIFFSDYNIYLFITYLILMCIFSYAVRKCAKEKFLYSFIILFSVYLLPSGGFRQFCAMNIFLLSLIPAMQRKAKIYLIIIILGGFIHRSLWLCMPIYLFLSMKINLKNFVVIIIVGLILYNLSILNFAIDMFLKYASSPLFSSFIYRINMYNQMTEEESILSIGFIRKVVFVLYFLYVRHITCKKNPDTLIIFNKLLNVYIIGLISTMIFTGTFMRIASYFSYVECLLFPLSLQMIKKRDLRILITITVCIIFIIILDNKLSNFYPHLFIPYKNILFV